MFELLGIKNDLISYAKKLQSRYDISLVKENDYFEPGMMEYLDKNYGRYDEINNCLTISFEIKGTRYEGRTRIIDFVENGDPLNIKRDENNIYNKNNFVVLNSSDEDLGNFPADLCNLLAPLYDKGYIEIKDSKVSFVDHLLDRSIHAKQAILFAEIVVLFKGI